MKMDKELIVFYSGFGGDPNLKPLTEVTKRFEENNPEVRVLVYYQNRFAPSSSLEEINPDLFFLQHGDFRYFQKMGYTADLKPFFRQRGINPSDSVPDDILNLLQENGELTAIPVSINLFGAAYNKEYFRNAGIPIPNTDWTWEQIFDISRELQSLSRGDEFLGAKLILHLDLLENLVMSNGGSYLSPDGSRASGYLNGRATVEVIDWVVDFIRKHRLSVNTGEFREISVDEFNEGKVAMTFNRHEDLKNISKAMSDRVGFIGMPRFVNGVRAVPPIIYGFGLSTRSKHPDLAFDLLCNLALRDNPFMREEAKNPQVTLLRESEAQLDEMELALKRAMESQYPFLRKGAYLLNRKWSGSLWSGRLEALMHKHVSVKDVLDEIATTIDVTINAAAGH